MDLKMMKFAIFASLLKVDVAAHTVTGVIADETRDLTGEIFDYETSKPHFSKWSDGIAKATDGKSVGNVRAMHGNVVAGRLSELLADDATKSITVTAHIVDDNEWNKVLTGCYTGFSIGGKYDKKWADPTDATLKRYTAIPSEVSIVDLPCNPSAQFTVIKADGASEMRKFAVEEPAVFDADLVLKLFQGADSIDVVKALIVQHDADLLTGYVRAPVIDHLIVQGQAARLFAQLDKSAPLADAITITMGREPVEKGMWDVSRFADLLCSLASLSVAVKYEASAEGDNSPVPAKLDAATAALGAIFLELAAEEVDELLTSQAEPVASFAYVVPGGDLQKALVDVAAADVALAKAAEDLAKASGERDAAVAELAKYKRNTAAPAKGTAVVVSKSADGQTAVASENDDLLKRVEAMPVGEDKARALLLLSMRGSS